MKEANVSSLLDFLTKTVAIHARDSQNLGYVQVVNVDFEAVNAIIDYVNKHADIKLTAVSKHPNFQDTAVIGLGFYNSNIVFDLDGFTTNILKPRRLIIPCGRNNNGFKLNLKKLVTAYRQYNPHLTEDDIKFLICEEVLPGLEVNVTFNEGVYDYASPYDKGYVKHVYVPGRFVA